MSTSKLTHHQPKNALYRMAAAYATLLGVFLLMGASGHFFGVRAEASELIAESAARAIVLVMPALILLVTGVINIGLSRALWTSKRGALAVALGANLTLMIYLIHLLVVGIPGHPIGKFLAMVGTLVVILGAIRAGLVWPSPTPNDRGGDTAFD